MDEIGKLLEHLGYATPVIYAAAAYRLFAWLDKDASDEAKAALASTMKLKDYDAKRIASALVEVFDRIYTYPLLSWRAFIRSMLFTVAVSAAFLFELPDLINVFRAPGMAYALGAAFALMIISDYLSLFIMRPWVKWCGERPVFALFSGAALGVVLVNLGSFIRGAFFGVTAGVTGAESNDETEWALAIFNSVPATVVFAWLPLFALGISVTRLLTVLSSVADRAQRFLKDGKEHPLKAIGCVAAVFVFVPLIILRMFFGM